MHLTRSHIHALGQQQISGSQCNCVFVINQVLRVCGRRGAQEHQCGRRSREHINRSQRIASGIHRRRERNSSRGAGQGLVSGYDKLLQATSAKTGLRVNRIHASNGENVTLFDGFGCAVVAP